MATKKVIIATIKDSEKWINITDNEGVEYGIMKEKSPKLTEILKTAKPGDEITADHSIGKDGEKNFLWDPKATGQGGKPFAPKNYSREAALYAAQATGSALALQKDVNLDKFKEFAEGVHAWIMSKTSL